MKTKTRESETRDGYTPERAKRQDVCQEVVDRLLAQVSDSELRDKLAKAVADLVFAWL